MMLATETSKEICLSDIYKVTKKNTLSRLKRDARQCSDRSRSDECMEAKAIKVRPTSVDNNTAGKESSSCVKTPQCKRRQDKSSDDFDTPLRETGRNRPNLRTRTPGKRFDLQLEDGLTSPPFSSSSSPSQSIANFLTPDSSSPLCISSPGRKWQLSQDSTRDVTWDCTSPVNQYIRRSAHDTSNIQQLCRPWHNARWDLNKQNKKESSLLDKWFSEKRQESNCIQETRSAKKDTGKKAGGSVFSKELLELIKCDESTCRGQENLSSKLSRTPAKLAGVKSPNCSSDDLWGDDDESFMIKVSQLSPILFGDSTAEMDSVLQDTNSTFTRIVEKNSKGEMQLTPSRPTQIKSGNGDQKVPLRIAKDSSFNSDDLWNDNDDETEIFSQEVLTMLDKKIEEATRPHRCTPEEIDRKRQNAIIKRTRRSVWNGRLRTPR